MAHLVQNNKTDLRCISTRYIGAPPGVRRGSTANATHFATVFNSHGTELPNCHESRLDTLSEPRNPPNIAWLRRYRSLSQGMRAMFDEFKKFALRGNVVDLAGGGIIGAAFGAIVSSLGADIINPIIGAITGGLDFSNHYTPLAAKVQAGLAYADAKKQGAVLGWGQFLTVTINFLIVAWVLFMAIRAINKLRTKEPPPPPPAPSEEVKLLAE